LLRRERETQLRAGRRHLRAVGRHTHASAPVVARHDNPTVVDPKDRRHRRRRDPQIRAVFHRDAELARERVEQPDVVRPKRVQRLALDIQHSEHFARRQNRHGQLRSGQAVLIARDIAWIQAHIADIQRLLLERDPAGDALTDRDAPAHTRVFIGAAGHRSHHQLIAIAQQDRDALIAKSQVNKVADQPQQLLGPHQLGQQATDLVEPLEFLGAAFQQRVLAAGQSKQLGVLQRDRTLGSHRVQQIEMLFSKIARCMVNQRNHTQHALLAQNRHRSGAANHLLVRRHGDPTRVIARLRDDRGLALAQHPAGDTVAQNIIGHNRGPVANAGI
jgi:hypothetical protein